MKNTKTHYPCCSSNNTGRTCVWSADSIDQEELCVSGFDECASHGRFPVFAVAVCVLACKHCGFDSICACFLCAATVCVASDVRQHPSGSKAMAHRGKLRRFPCAFVYFKTTCKESQRVGLESTVTSGWTHGDVQTLWEHIQHFCWASAHGRADRIWHCPGRDVKPSGGLLWQTAYTARNDHHKEER